MKKTKTQLKLLKLFLVELTAKTFRRSSSGYRTDLLDLSYPNSSSKTSSKTLVVAHIYYLDQVEYLLERLSALPHVSAVFVTTPSRAILKAAEQFSSKFKAPFNVMLLPNIGRNFGPLFEVMSRERMNFEYLLHVHGKKSLHTRRKKIEPWIETLHSNLLKPKHFESILELLQSDHSIAIAYPNVSKYISEMNMCWGLNFEPISGQAAQIGIGKPQLLTEKLNFPAGGMFLLRLSNYQNLFAEHFFQNDFAEERGSVDGALEHGLERLFGAVADENGLSQVALNFETGVHVKLSPGG